MCIVVSSTGHCKNTFQRSPDTISKCVAWDLIWNTNLIVLRVIHRMLTALTSKNMYHVYVRLPPDNYSFQESIMGTWNRKKFILYFNGCLGALDATHIPVYVPKMLHAGNQKGEITQNVLAVCSFNMKIIYILSGWERSASNSCVFEDAQTSDFWIPPDWYYLGDAGYADSDAVLVPYWNVRYHLKEWGSGNNRFIITISKSPSCISTNIY